MSKFIYGLFHPLKYIDLEVLGMTISSLIILLVSLSIIALVIGLIFRKFSK